MSIHIETSDLSPTDYPATVLIPNADGTPAQSAVDAPWDDASQPDNSNQTRRVLLLEDDARLHGMLREAGFTIRITKNGLDALKEIMATDFTAILCDMSMPGMAGNVLYRAIERVRPHLCERFICMTERPGDGTENGLLKSTNGHLLFKPVDLEELLDVLTFVETRTELIKCLDDRSRVVRKERIISFRESPAPMHAREDSADTAESGDVRRPFSRAAIGAVAALALLAGGSTMTSLRDSDIQKRAEDSSSELSARELQWTGTLVRQQEVELARKKLEALESLSSNIQMDRKSSRWTVGLQSVSTAIGPEIELLGFEARSDSENPSGFVLRLSGSSSGHEPRKTADQFREALEHNLKQGTGRQTVQTRFEKLDESPQSRTNAAAPIRAGFTIIATCAPEVLGELERKGER